MRILNALIRALRVFKRLRELEAIANATATCQRCGARMDISIARTDGPRVVEQRVQGRLIRIVVCPWCTGRCEQLGWKRVRPAAAEGANA